MKRTLAILGVLLPLALPMGCQGSGSATGESVRQFRAWSWSQSKPLGDWTTDEELAKKQVAEYKRLYPHYNASVKVFTGPLQKPSK
ncbi:MAG: hypothetical protein AAGD14_10435 [Planctomycetota bacterium]